MAEIAGADAAPASVVEVWFCPMDLAAWALGICESLVSAEEAARARRFRADHQRAEYLVGHAMLRTILSARLGIAPAVIEFTTGAHGKPLAGPDWPRPDLVFNLTHTNGLAAVAIGSGARLGLDAEAPDRDIDWEPLARRYFSPAEHRAIERLPAPRRKAAFFACWCRKEALVKAEGAGIAAGLHSFDVSVDPEAPPRLLAGRGSRWEDSAWSLASIETHTRYVVCLAMEGPPRDLRVRRWTPPPRNPG